MGTTNQRNDLEVTGNLSVTGDVIVGDALTVDGTLTATLTGEAGSVNGLDFAAAPVEVDSGSVTLADDIYAALVTLGLLVDVA